MPIEIEFSNLIKIYEEKSLYKNLSGKIKAGQCTCITGNNGSGKSTFLKIIAGLSRPTSGSMLYHKEGRVCSLANIREQIAFVSPEMQLYDALTATENLLFFASMAANSPLAKELVPNALQMVGLSSDADKKIATFSTGMKQRLKLAMLPASDRSLWLLDEPSSNLDSAGRKIVEKLIEHAKKKQYTVLLATNDPLEVAYADTIFCLS